MKPVFLILNKKIIFIFHVFFCCLLFTGCVIPVTTKGYIDKTGKMVIKPQFYYAQEFHEGIALVAENDNQKIRYIDTTGRYISNMIFTNTSENFSEGLALAYAECVGCNNTTVLINKSGQIVLENNGLNHGFKEGLASKDFIISNGEENLRLTGFINKQWKTMIKPYYYTYASFSEGLCKVEAAKTRPTPPSEYRFGYINKNGKLIIGLKYSGADDFSEGLAGVQVIKTKKWGYINKLGKMVITPKFDSADSFLEGLARVSIKEKYFFINKKGEGAFKKYFISVRDFHDGLAWFEDANGKYGYIDKTGEIAIKPVFCDAWDFSEGLANVKMGPASGWGYIDKTGKMIIKDKYWSAGQFSEGLAAVAPGFPYLTYMVLIPPGI